VIALSFLDLASVSEAGEGPWQCHYLMALLMKPIVMMVLHSRWKGLVKKFAPTEVGSSLSPSFGAVLADHPRAVVSTLPAH
jgi:hypothetical protein